MKSNCVILLILFLQSVVHSENQYISLEGLFFEMNNAGFYIEEVIDARQEKYCIGFVQKGIANKKEPAFFGKGLENEMMDFFSKTLPNNGDSEPIIIKFNHLFIYEVTYQDREIATVELNVSFLKKEENGYVELLEIGTGLDKMGMDVTKHHAKNIVEALQNCFKIYKQRKESGNLIGNKIEKDKIHEFVLGNNKNRINESPNFQKGVYHSYGDFKDNIIDTKHSFNVEHKIIEKKDGKKSIILWDKNSQIKDTDLWGFCDGQDNYIRVNDYYYQISKKGDNFIVRAPEVGDGNGAVTGALLGGIAGALIGGAIQNASAEYVDYKIDNATGRITSLEEPIYKKIESRFLVASSRYNNDDVPFNLFLDGEKMCMLQSGEYYQASITPTKQIVEICVESEAGKSCENIETALFKTTYFLISTSKKKAPKLGIPNLTLRNEIANDIEDGKFLKVCVE